MSQDIENGSSPSLAAFFSVDLMVLRGGGTKSGQQKDIEQALIYAKLYKARKKS